MKKYNINKAKTHNHTHARARIKSKNCLTETRTHIDFFHLIKQNLM